MRFAVYAEDGKELFAGDLPVSYDPQSNGPPSTIEEVLALAERVNENSYVLPAFRLDLQRIALLAPPDVIQWICSRIGT